jgi:hypothetical protein
MERRVRWWEPPLTLNKFGELARDVRGVAVEHRGVASPDLALETQSARSCRTTRNTYQGGSGQ